MSKPFGRGQTPGIDCCIQCGETENLQTLSGEDGDGDLYCPEHFKEVQVWAARIGQQEKREEKQSEKRERESLGDAIISGIDECTPQQLLANARLLFKKQDYRRARYVAAKWLSSIYHIIVEESTGTIRTYDREKGYYVSTGEEILRSALVGQFRDYLGKASAGEIMHFIRSFCLKRHDEIAATTPLNLLCCTNGVLDLDTLTILPHSPTRLFLSGLPVRWDPDAECPAIENYFAGIATPEDRERLLDIFGLSIYRHHLIEKFFILVGEGSNGKTRILKLLEALVGRENYSSVTLQDLADDPYMKAQLYEKLVNMAGDISGGTIKNASILKTLSGGDPLTAHNKYEAHFQFTSHATMIFSSNDPPRFVEDSDGLWRRVVLIKFPFKFGTEEEVKENPGWKVKDINLDQKITAQDEIAGLLVLAVKALKGIIARGALSHETTTAESRVEYRRISDPVAAFLDEYCEPCDYLPPDREAGVGAEGFVIVSELYAAFKEFCASYGIRPLSGEWFGRYLKNAGSWNLEAGRDRVGGVQQRTIRGVRLRQQDGKTAFPFVSYISPNKPHTPSKGKCCLTDSLSHSEFDFPTKYDVLDALQALQAAEKNGEPVAFEAVASHFPGLHETVQARLSAAAREGEAFEPRSGFWGRL